MKYLILLALFIFSFACGSDAYETEKKETTTAKSEISVDRKAAPLPINADKNITADEHTATLKSPQESGTAATNTVVDEASKAEAVPVKLSPKAEKTAVEIQEKVAKKRKSPAVEKPIERVEIGSETQEVAPTVVASNSPPSRPSTNVVSLDHTAWNELLSNYVSASGEVNYTGLKKQEAALDTYLTGLAKAIPNKDWTPNAAMAYWMNAYNAFTVKLILKNWPVKSIMDLHGGKPWDVKWVELAGKKYSLNQIEHDILRPRYKDARIHFAVNCAAQSCPPLHNRAFTEGTVKSKLQRLAKSFINNDKYNTISSDKVSVSKIFDWYKSDFGKLTDYLNKYSSTKIVTGTEITFKEYDWGLNGR